MEPDAPLLTLPTAARTRWRVKAAITGTVLGLVLSVAPGILLLATGNEAAAALPSLVFVAIGVGFGMIWANRRYARFGYRLDEVLRVRDGVIFHDDAIAPLYRVQHVDLTRGPLQRGFGLATLTVHTAAPAADITLPDLRVEDAERVRDEILAASRRAAAELGVADVDAV